MQAQTPEVSGAKASTARTRPTMASHRLDLPSICDICGEAIGHAAVCRSLGDKQTDPVLRAALWDAAALLYEQAAQIERMRRRAERLAEALRDAATSMQTIADKAGRDEYLMTDRYERIRAALAMGPTPGPWEPVTDRPYSDLPYLVLGAGASDAKSAEWVPLYVHVGGRSGWMEQKANTLLIAACDPDTIRALLEERDALQAENERRMAALATQQPSEQHPDDAAVDRFAATMKAKLKKKRQEGRGGWQSMTSEQLSALLQEHVRKGDPVDVANLAMMLHQNGQVIICGPEHRASHPAITHCDNCGCDWLDNGLNPVDCPYCKQHATEALLEELDALKAENEMLREALKDADSEMDWLDEDMDTCDHSVGVCMCSYWSVRRKMKAALAREDKHD